MQGRKDENLGPQFEDPELQMTSVKISHGKYCRAQSNSSGDQQENGTICTALLGIHYALSFSYF